MYKPLYIAALKKLLFGQNFQFKFILPCYPGTQETKIMSPKKRLFPSSHANKKEATQRINIYILIQMAAI